MEGGITLRGRRHHQLPDACRFIYLRIAVLPARTELNTAHVRVVGQPYHVLGRSLQRIGIATVIVIAHIYTRGQTLRNEMNPAFYNVRKRVRIVFLQARVDDVAATRNVSQTVLSVALSQ